MDEKDLVSTLESAAIIGCCRSSIENYRRRGWLHPVRLANGRILFLKKEVEGLREHLLVPPKGVLVQASQATGEKPKYQSLKIDPDQTIFGPKLWKEIQDATRKYQEARRER